MMCICSSFRGAHFRVAFSAFREERRTLIGPCLCKCLLAANVPYLPARPMGMQMPMQTAHGIPHAAPPPPQPTYDYSAPSTAAVARTAATSAATAAAPRLVSDNRPVLSSDEVDLLRYST